MLVSALLKPEAVATDVVAETKADVLRLLVDLATAAGTVLDSQGALTALLEREQLCSTAIGMGIAIPHAAQPLPGVFKGVSLAAVLLKDGIPGDSPDGKPVRLFVGMGTDDRKQHLVILGRLARLFRVEAVREELMRCHTPEEFVEALKRAEHALNRLNGA